jgi:hypothetical protein
VSTTAQKCGGESRWSSRRKNGRGRGRSGPVGTWAKYAVHLSFVPLLGSKRWSVAVRCRAGRSSLPTAASRTPSITSTAPTWLMAVTTSPHSGTSRVPRNLADRSQEGSGTLKVYPVYQSTTYRIRGGYASLTPVRSSGSVPLYKLPAL